jgi:hypothetical protein
MPFPSLRMAKTSRTLGLRGSGFPMLSPGSPTLQAGTEVRYRLSLPGLPLPGLPKSAPGVRRIASSMHTDPAPIAGGSPCIAFGLGWQLDKGRMWSAFVCPSARRPVAKSCSCTRGGQRHEPHLRLAPGAHLRIVSLAFPLKRTAVPGSAICRRLIGAFEKYQQRPIRIG